MSVLSHLIDKVLPGAPSRNFTENTWDKIIAPEHKDTVESLATMVVAPYLTAGLLPGLANMLGSTTAARALLGGAQSWATGGSPVAGALAGAYLPKLDKFAGQYIKNPLLRNMATGLVGGGILGDPFAMNAGQSVGAAGLMASQAAPKPVLDPWAKVESAKNFTGNILNPASTDYATGIAGQAKSGVGNLLNLTSLSNPLTPIDNATSAFSMSSLLKGAGMQGLGMLAGGGGGTSSAGAATGSTGSAGAVTGSTGMDLLNQLMAGAKNDTKDTIDYGTNAINEAMQARGIRTSGVHMQAMQDYMKQVAESDATAKYKMALDVYSALDRDTQANLDRELQASLANMGYANAQSLQNQQERSQLAGTFGQLLGMYLYSTQFGGGKGGAA